MPHAIVLILKTGDLIVKIYAMSVSADTLKGKTAVFNGLHYSKFNPVENGIRPGIKYDVSIEHDTENVCTKLAATLLGAHMMSWKIIDWTVFATINRLDLYAKHSGLEENQRGLLLYSDSKASMVKGLRKIFDAKGESEGYVIKNPSGLGVACAQLSGEVMKKASTMGALIKTFAHNTGEKLHRGMMKQQMSEMTKEQRKKFLNENNIDHLFTYSGALQDVKTSKWGTGFAAFIGPSDSMPSESIGKGNVTRLMGSSLNCGQLAAFVKHADEDRSNRSGGMNFDF